MTCEKCGAPCQGRFCGTHRLEERSGMAACQDCGDMIHGDLEYCGDCQEKRAVTDGGSVETGADVHPTDLSLFQHEICYLLARDGAEYGLGLKEALEERYGEEVNHGRLYPNLDDLVELGLVDKSALDKRTNEYALTAEGRFLVRADAERRNAVATHLNGGER